MGDKNPSVAGLVDAGPSEIANKPTEPTFKLGLTANKIIFKCGEDRKPVSVPIKIFNPTQATVSFKIRCTSADIFRVQPPIGIVKAQGVTDIIIWFQNTQKVDKNINKHYFAFYHTKADSRTPKEIWSNAKPDGVRRIPAIFEYTGEKKSVSQASAT
ncbi:unnamed protein product [Caenorhabditis bovis]|uniref:Major sperm protein n=1 Tax=Caenorhabditis bovis TaxID=2654633 RepID=A0A8S1F934_9PELO|nr:unnamed protein product [Caenorhabditis bovis]